MENDYSQLEIDNIIVELKTVHKGKLKHEEIEWLKQLQRQNTITQPQRDLLIGMYDRMGETDYG